MTDVMLWGFVYFDYIVEVRECELPSSARQYYFYGTLKCTTVLQSPKRMHTKR